MGILKKLSPSLLMVLSVPAFAGVIVYSPANGSDVSSIFTVSAFANWCGTQSVTAIGYSLDNSTYTDIVNGQNLNVQVSAGSGWHTLHAKAWGQNGVVCVTDVSVNVAATPSLVAAG